MRRLIVLILAAVLVLSCTSPQTADGPVYRSEHGFTIKLSSQWLVVHRLDIGGKETRSGRTVSASGAFSRRTFSAG